MHKGFRVYNLGLKPYQYFHRCTLADLQTRMSKSFLRVEESPDDHVLGFCIFVDVQTQTRKGFQKVEESLDDIALDSPLVKSAFAT